MSTDVMFTSECWNMSGLELDCKTHKIKENGKMFWGAYVIIQNDNGTFDYFRIDSNQIEPKQFDTERKALNFVKKLVPNLTKRDHVVIYTRQRYEKYLATYEQEKREEAQRT